MTSWHMVVWSAMNSYDDLQSRTMGKLSELIGSSKTSEPCALSDAYFRSNKNSHNCKPWLLLPWIHWLLVYILLWAATYGAGFTSQLFLLPLTATSATDADLDALTSSWAPEPATHTKHRLLTDAMDTHMYILYIMLIYDDLIFTTVCSTVSRLPCLELFTFM